VIYGVLKWILYIENGALNTSIYDIDEDTVGPVAFVNIVGCVINTLLSEPRIVSQNWVMGGA
jgi:hypothetical protein